MITPALAIEPYAALFTRPAEEVLRELEIYVALLARWQPVQNLVSRETLPEFWTRHIADSLQVLKLVRAEDRAFLDLGSGGGLPAIPLAAALKGKSRFTLVEPTARKVSFLRTAARGLQLELEVVPCRAEQIDSRETSVPDVITSRAVAALSELLALTSPFFGPETRAIFHKGREYGEEITQARGKWSFDVLIVASDTSPDAALLEISNLRAISRA